MRAVWNALLIVALLLYQNAGAATAPAGYVPVTSSSDSGFTNRMLLKGFQNVSLKRAGIFQRLEYKFLQKRIAKSAQRHGTDTAFKKNDLSTISLVLGIVSALALFIPTVSIVALLAAPAALVTGILALGKRYNNNKKSRARAIIGIILGSVTIFIILLALIVFLSGGFWGA